MTTIYLPRWKDGKGNSLVLMAWNWHCKSREEALQKKLADFIFLIPFGLTGDGIAEFELDEEGKARVTNVAADHPVLGPVVFLAGPIVDAAELETVS